MSSHQPRFYRADPGQRRRGGVPMRWLLPLLMVAGGAILLFGESGILAVHQSTDERDRMQNELQELRASTSEVEGDLASLKEARSPMLEKVARERYLLRRDGERVLQVVAPDDSGEGEEKGRRTP